MKKDKNTNEAALRRAILSTILTMDECDISRVSCVAVFDNVRDELTAAYGPQFEVDFKSFQNDYEANDAIEQYHRLRGRIRGVLSVLGQEVGSFTEAKDLIAGVTVGIAEALGDPITAAERLTSH